MPTLAFPGPLLGALSYNSRMLYCPLAKTLIKYRVRVISAVRVEDGEEVDRELWVLLEELQERKQALAAENTALRARTPTGSWKCAPAATPLTLFSNGHLSHCQSGECGCCP